MNQFPSCPRVYQWGCLKVYIRNFVFIAGINDIVEKLFTGVNETGDKLLVVSLLTVINYWWCRC
jgi:hypothetical protein